jgi:CHAD domain-containing protein
MKKAAKKPTFENLHDWRKRVKDLCYQARLLRNLWSREVKTLAKESNKLGDYLGDDHDFAEMIEYIKANPGCCRSEDERNALLALIKRRREELQAAAWPLGRRIYSESPGDFIDRVESYWDAFEQSQRLQDELRRAA